MNNNAYLALTLQYFGHMYAFVNSNKVQLYDVRRSVSNLMHSWCARIITIVYQSEIAVY